ncbi:MAG: hypothetical protein KDF59_16655 [Nitrosomonas sp.]|nr:hypothetical protein [Nitrosomonas sp.]
MAIVIAQHRGIEGSFRDYIGAEQAVMAIELIIIDRGKKEQLQSQLQSQRQRQIDELYKQVENDEVFQAAQFIQTLKKLKKVLN